MTTSWPAVQFYQEGLGLVYIPDQADLEAVVKRLGDPGHSPVAPENPYWAQRWRIVLQNTAGI